MTTFYVHFTQIANTVVTVEASSLESALVFAHEQLPGSLCHQCAHLVDIDPGEWELATTTVEGGEDIDHRAKQ